MFAIDDALKNAALWELIDAYRSTDPNMTFSKFRKLMYPRLIQGWWTNELDAQLTRFIDDLLAGKAPKLILQAPRQHGKSHLVIDVIAYVSGKAPYCKTIFTSYSERLGIRANLRLQRILDDPKYQTIFPGTQLPDLGSNKYVRNHNLLEFVQQEGSFRNTTVGGRTTGESLDLGVLDDPLKGREEANSSVIRDKTWDWFTDDFMGCFSDKAALLVICTRYHVDDPAGRMIETMPDLKQLRYSAIAEKDEEHRKKGEPLFPEFKSLSWLNERKATLTQGGWMSIYQQTPIVVGGGLFPIDKFEIVGNKPGLKPAPSLKEIKRTVRYIDKAGTADGGAYTAMVLMHSTHDGRFFVSDVRRGQWSALERERHMKQTVVLDRNSLPAKPYDVWIEQEPGSGGKESAENSIRMLAGFTAKADKVTGSKEVRAEPYAAQVQAGNVMILAAEWNREYLNEHEQFPSGKYVDQVDAASGAFMKLTTGTRYDSSLQWVG